MPAQRKAPSQKLRRGRSRKTLPARRQLRGVTDAPISRPKGTRAAGSTRAGGEGDAPGLLPLGVTVVNGDLTFERDALLLGHYHATRLTGTEKVMDGLLGGTMARSLAMGVYPVAPGSHQIFINTRPNLERGMFLPRPLAVIVVGLGEEGKLRPADLASSVRQAVIAWSQRLAEQNDGSAPTFNVAATLLGSGGTGVSAGEAARLIAEGVYEANTFITSEGGGRPSPRVGHLRFVELYLDRATDAWKALRLQADARPGRYDVTGFVEPGSGGLTRHPELGYRGAEYDFITVEAVKDADGAPIIAYNLDTRRARSEVRGQRAQSRLIGELIAAGSSDKNNDERIGRTLFNLLVPMEIEAYLAGSGEMQIELDPQTAAIPWELLESERESGEDLPWAIRVKLLRKLRVRRFREAVTDAGAEGGALVIGEPECPMDDFPRLFGARAEALAVRAALTGEGGLAEEAVVGLISQEATQTGPSATDVVNALFERPWRIVHIAGHGVLGKDGNPGGVVLSDGAFLGPAEIGNMRTVPNLIFVNCCHLGAADSRQLLNTRYDRATFASGLAGALIERGVRCVIAAGWAVDDEGARVFAETFYGSLLRGERFIDAVSHARRETYLHDPLQNTWAAYQCYGDPDWTFRPAPPDANRVTTPSVDEFSGIASALSLKLALERIHVQVRFQGADPGKQLDKLRHLETVHAARWGGQGDVAELFGAAFTEAGDVEAGLRWYEKAVASADGRASMRAAEQCADVRSRLAWEIVDRAKRHVDALEGREKPAASSRKARADAEQRLARDTNRAEELIGDSLALLEKLTAIQPTLERANLVGTVHKRRALVNIAADRQRQAEQDLRRMLASCAEAQAMAERTDAAGAFHPAANCLIAEVALNAGKGRWRSLDTTRVKIIKAALGAREPDFWTVMAEIDLDLYDALATRRLAAKRPALENAYEDLHRRVPSTRMWGSVYDTACLVLPAYAGRASGRERDAATALLARVRSFAHPA